MAFTLDRDEELLTTDEVAAVLRFSPRGVARAMREGRLPGRKLGNCWRCRRGDLDRFVRSDLQPADVAR